MATKKKTETPVDLTTAILIEIRNEVLGLRKETHSELAAVRSEIHELRAEMQTELTAVRTEVGDVLTSIWMSVKAIEAQTMDRKLYAVLDERVTALERKVG